MKAIDKILILCSFLAVFTSCKKDLANYNIQSVDEKLALKADTTNLILDVTNPNGKAIKFTWTKGSNKGTNAAITYQFQLAKAGTNFQNGLVINMERGVTNLEYTQDEFNNLLVNTLALPQAQEVQLEAKVIATVHADGQTPQVTEILKLKVKTYKPISKTLYLIGPASEGGWNADLATPMNVVNGVAGSFTWQGRLTAGDLKFITTLGKFLPAYVKGATSQQLALRETDTDPDDKFTITATGIYLINVNIITKTISIEAKEAPEYGQLWFVSGFNGWSFQPMTVDLLDPFVFHYNATLNSSNSLDEFKIATAPSFDSKVVYIRPAVNGQNAGTNLAVVKLSGENNPEDNKWKIAPGTYKIKLNLRTMKIDIVKFTPSTTMYMVGSATPNGWDISNATPFTAVSGNPYRFTWTGTLTSDDGKSELKFSLDKKSDWSGAFFLASSASKAPSGAAEPMVFSASGSGTDNKWKIAATGNYTIELDQLQETVKFIKN